MTLEDITKLKKLDEQHHALECSMSTVETMMPLKAKDNKKCQKPEIDSVSLNFEKNKHE